MNELIDKAHKQGMPQSDKCTHNKVALFNNHPYISSSGTPVGTKFTATYVGMAVLWSAYHCVAFLVYVLRQPVHSMNDSSLHQ